jgi:hypothetical protein
MKKLMLLVIGTIALLAIGCSSLKCPKGAIGWALTGGNQSLVPSQPTEEVNRGISLVEMEF